MQSDLMMNRSNIRRIGNAVVLLAMIGLLSACGGKHKDEKGSQSIVRVNGDEITVHQLNIELQRANVQPAQQEAAAKQLTSALVDRQILVQEALKTKMDRNPRVLQMLESAKAQILAQAYLEEKVASLAKPTDAEIAAYRSKHPEIFANRKVYLMDEVAFPLAGHEQDIQGLSQSAKSNEDVINWLQSKQIKFNRTRAAHAAETMPPAFLEKISKMNVGDIIFVNGSGQGVAGRILEIKDAPISEADSKPLIERILASEKRKDVAEKEMERLRKAAKIEYINKDYDPAGKGETKSPQDAKPAATEKPAEGAKPEEKRKPSSIEKGLSGL